MTAHSAIHHDPSAAQLAIQEYEATARREHDHRQVKNAKLYALGRAFVASLFIISAVAKLIDYRATVQSLADTIAAPEVLLPFGIAIELIGGLALFVGFRARIVSMGLIAYLGVVTLLVTHDLTNALSRSMALSNLAFAGALLMVVAHGAGALSVDRLTRKG